MTPVDYLEVSGMINTLPYIVHHLFSPLGPREQCPFCSLLPQQISSPVLYLRKDIFPDVCALHRLADWMAVVRIVINPMLAWCVWGAASGQTHRATIKGCLRNDNQKSYKGSSCPSHLNHSGWQKGIQEVWASLWELRAILISCVCWVWSLVVQQKNVGLGWASEDLGSRTAPSLSGLHGVRWRTSLSFRFFTCK